MNERNYRRQNKAVPVISSSSVSHSGPDSSAALSGFIGGVSSEETGSSISLPPAKYQELLLGMPQLLRNSAWKTPASVQVRGSPISAPSKAPRG